jgi:hypothetical protein
MPAEASRPCALYVLPERPSLGDLESGYGIRGAQLVACNAARKLAVDTYQAGQDLIDEQQKDRKTRARWWAFWR